MQLHCIIYTRLFASLVDELSFRNGLRTLAENEMLSFEAFNKKYLSCTLRYENWIVGVQSGKHYPEFKFYAKFGTSTPYYFVNESTKSDIQQVETQIASIELAYC